MDVEQQLTQCIDLLKEVFETSLLGVYLFGSALVGGLQQYSDLDLFIVIDRPVSEEEKERLINRLLKISGIYMKGTPIEITIVEKEKIVPWRYPPHYDFQYGEWLRDSFEKGIVEPTGEMPDLAVIITQVLLKSKTLYGPHPQNILQPIPHQDFTQAMLHHIDSLANDLDDDTRNVLLTLARIWNTLATNTICSKPTAADWVLNYLPHRLAPIILRAKAICIGTEPEYWDDLKPQIRPCADYMIEQIQSLAKKIDHTKTIKLAE